MFRNIGIWNSFNFNAKKVAKVAHPLREGWGPGGSGPDPIDLVRRDHKRSGSLTRNDHSESDNENVKKEIVLISNATTLHMQQTLFWAFLCCYYCTTTRDVEFPQAGRRFMKEVNTPWRVSFVSPSKLGFVPLEFNSKKFSYIWYFMGVRIIVTKFENKQNLLILVTFSLSSQSLAAVVAKAPYYFPSRFPAPFLKIWIATAIGNRQNSVVNSKSRQEGLFVFLSSLRLFLRRHSWNGSRLWQKGASVHRVTKKSLDIKLWQSCPWAKSRKTVWSCPRREVNKGLKSDLIHP